MRKGHRGGTGHLLSKDIKNEKQGEEGEYEKRHKAQEDQRVKVRSLLLANGTEARVRYRRSTMRDSHE